MSPSCRTRARHLHERLADAMPHLRHRIAPSCRAMPKGRPRPLPKHLRPRGQWKTAHPANVACAGSSTLRLSRGRLMRHGTPRNGCRIVDISADAFAACASSQAKAVRSQGRARPSSRQSAWQCECRTLTLVPQTLTLLARFQAEIGERFHRARDSVAKVSPPACEVDWL